MSQSTGVNKVILLGEIASQTSTTEDGGDEHCSLLVIVTKETLKRGSTTYEHTEFHNVKIPQKLTTGQNVTLTTGQSIYLEGKIQTTNFIDEDGIRRYDLEIIVTRIEMMGNTVQAPITLLP